MSSRLAPVLMVALSACTAAHTPKPNPTEDSGQDAPETATEDTEDPEDTDTSADTAPLPEEDCDSPGDEDGDGLADCDDPDCIGSCPEDCTNGVDDDGDGDTDCDDTDCVRECGEDCSDGIDNDLDGRTDCEDADCTGEAGCLEICAAGSGDEDFDGLLDCADDDCWGTSHCAGLSVWLESGTLDKHRESQRYLTSYLQPGTSSHITWRTTHVNFAFDVSVANVTGRARLQTASGSQTCAFAFDRAWFHKDNDTEGPGPFIPLVERSGFATTGDCTLSSAQLASGVKSVAGGVLAYGSGILRSGWWYHGDQALLTQTSSTRTYGNMRTQSLSSWRQVTLEPGQPVILPAP